MIITPRQSRRGGVGKIRGGADRGGGDDDKSSRVKTPQAVSGRGSSESGHEAPCVGPYVKICVGPS